MKAIAMINIMAEMVIFLSSIYILFNHYGNTKSNLDKHLHRYEYLAMKLGLIVMSMGSLMNLLDQIYLPTSQIVLNVGVSIYIVWYTVKLNHVMCEITDNYGKKSDVIDPKNEEFPDEEH